MTNADGAGRPRLGTRLWRRILLDTGIRDLTSAATLIVASVRAGNELANGPKDAEGPIEISKLASERGVSISEIERQLWNRQQTTKWRARVFGLAALYGAAEAELVITINARNVDVTTLAGMIGMACLAMIGLTSNAFINWQVRERRLQRFQTFLQHPACWWPR